MARQKGGLGRGLDSLLGSAPGEGASHEKDAPKERVAVNADTHKAPAAPDKANSGNGKPAEKPAATPAPPKQDEPYAINEDNLTIKGVVQRQVSTEAQPARKSDSHPQQSNRAQAEIARGAVPKDTDELDINLIQPNPDQPRINFKKEELEELAESIKKNGLLQPILVRKDGDVYQIIAGERRWQACKLLGLEKVPVRIKEANDEESIILALIENIQRSDLNPIEEAYGYRRMMERGKMTQSQIAQAVSKGRSTVANALRLLELPEEAQQLLFEDKITAGHARAILSVPSKEGRAKLTKKLAEEKLSVRETETIARLMSGKKDEKKAPKPATPKSYKTVARSLRDALQTDVRVKSIKGKNKIEISFNDEADLQRLFRIITSE